MSLDLRARAAIASLALFAFNPHQRRGPDGRWIKMADHELKRPRRGKGVRTPQKHEPQELQKPKQAKQPPVAQSVKPDSSQYSGPRITPTASQQQQLNRHRELAADLASTRSGAKRDQLRQEMESTLVGLPSFLSNRAVTEARIMQFFDEMREEQSGLGDPADITQFQAELAAKLKESFAGKKIATRVTFEGLDKILNDGRFKTQHETGVSRGLNDSDRRAEVEREWFGVDPREDRTKAPYYGYVAVNGVDNFEDDSALANYGPIQVVFKDGVRQRATVTVGDSLEFKNSVRPSPINEPEFWSYNPVLDSGDEDDDVPGHDYSSEEFRDYTYVEAQIHGGLKLDDIEEITFPYEPDEGLAEKLDSKGIRWQAIG